MLNWFNKKLVPEDTEPTKTVVVPLPPATEQPAYQVGVTESGKVTLRLGDSYGNYGMLTMNDAGVLKLIDMLEAAMDGESVAVEGHDGRGPG